MALSRCVRENEGHLYVCVTENERTIWVCVKEYNSSGMCMYVFELQQLLLLSRYTSHVLRTSLCALLLYVNPNPWPGTLPYTHSHTWAMAAAVGQVAEDRRLFDYSGSSSSSLSFFLPGLHSLFAWNICSSFCYFFCFILLLFAVFCYRHSATPIETHLFLTPFWSAFPQSAADRTFFSLWVFFQFACKLKKKTTIS